MGETIFLCRYLQQDEIFLASLVVRVYPVVSFGSFC